MISFQEYINEDSESVYSGSVLKKYREAVSKRKLTTAKMNYDYSLKQNLQNIKDLNLDYSLKPFSTGTDKTLKTGSTYLPTAENREKIKNNQEIINNSSKVQESRKATTDALNDLRLAQYQYDVAKEENHDPTLWDKTVGVPIRATKDLLSMFSLTNNPSTKLYKDDNGNKSFLPTANEIRQQNVSNSYETKVGKLLSDITYNGTKILGSSILPGGNVVYWGDMFNDSFINTVNDGYNENDSLLYATLSTASELITSKLMGGLSKLVPGGNSNLSKTINKTLSKVMKNDRLRSVLSNALSEGSEEFVQEYVDLLNRNLVLGENNKLDLETFENALYSGLVGMGTGGISGAVNVDVNTNNTGIIPRVDNNGNLNIETYTNQLEDALNKETNPRQAERINDTLNILNMESDNIFSKQVDEVLNGTFNKQNHLTVLEHTPEVLQKLGFKDFPITLTVNKLERIMNDSGKQSGEYHGLGELVKKLPQAIQNPLDIIESYNNSYVLTTDLSDKQDRSIIISLKVDGKGYINDIKIDTNVMTSAYGRNNYDSWMEKNQREGKIVYDIDRGYINEKKLVSIPGLQLSNNRDKLNTDVQGLQLPNEVSLRNDSPGVESPNTIASSVNNDTIKPSKSQIAPLPNTSNMQKNTNNELKGSKILNPIEISKLRPKDANTTPTLPDRTYNKNNDGNSHFFENIRTKTNMLNENQKNVILNEDDVKYYDKITNKVTLEKAFDRLNENGATETNNWFAKDSEKATAIDVAEGWILLKQYADKNNADGMVAVAKKLRDMGTKAGQTVQAFNIMERMSPEGMVKYAQSELSEAYDKMVKNKSREWIEKYRDDFDLKPEEVSFIMKTMQEISKMEDGYDKRVKLAEIQKVMTDKLPPERGAGIKAWMRISMLFNPKTQVRNVMGNAVITPVNYFSDLFSGVVDKAISKKTGVRTIGKTDLKSYLKGFKTGLYQSYNDFKKGINTRNIQGNRFEISQGKSFNDNTKLGKSLNRVDSLLSFMLDAGDRGFYEASFTNSINNQLVLNNTTKVTQEMIDIATQEALSRTWQDNNGYTKFVLQTRSALNKINIKGYGLGDVLIPFAKTPANLTKAIVDYSPAGLVKTIIDGNNLKKSLSNGQYNAQLQHQFVQELGKATAGTMLYILGYALAKAGVVSGESDDDKDTRDFMKNTLGVSSYSIKIGNKSFTYDWAQPISAPLSIMANYVQKQKENASILENAISSLDEGFNIILQQSFFESINNVFSETGEVPEKIIEELLGLPSRAIPTLMKQIVDLTDSTQRQSFEYDQPLKTAVNKVVAKIPGLSYTLTPAIDTMGREIRKYGGKNNIFNVFLNPANVNTENISESAKEIYKIYKSTGDKTIMPRAVAYYINQNNEKIILSTEQRKEYQQISGKIIEDNVKSLKTNSNYKKMSDVEKASVINNIVNYSYNKARKDVLNIDMSNSYNKVNEWVNKGGKVYEYYANKEENDFSLESPSKYSTMTTSNINYYDYLEYQKKVNNIKDQYSGTENANVRKQKVFQYINGLNYNKNQKIILFKMLGGYSIKDYQSSIFSYINNLKISKNEKQEIWKYLYGE